MGVRQHSPEGVYRRLRRRAQGITVRDGFAIPTLNISLGHLTDFIYIKFC